MGKTLVFLLLLSTNVAFAQFQDDFADGNFTANPVWGGSIANFLINSSLQLQSNGPQSSATLYLSTPSTLANKVAFEFYISLGFDPSTTNYPRIYLTSSQQNLSATTGLQGYYLQLGSTGSADNFTLVRQNGTINTTILTLANKSRANANAVGVRVKVERDENGLWDIYTDFTGGTNYTLDGSVTDNIYTSSTHFGVYCRYATASRYNLFNFDDFKVTASIQDVAPPTLINVKTINDTQIEATFSEALRSTEASIATNYSLSVLGNPTSVTAISGNVYRLAYSTAIPSGNYTLMVNNVKDLKNNTIAAGNSITFLHIKSYIAKKGDVVINEIFADPSPIIGLPTTEFLEIWNTSPEYVSLKGWKYSDATSTYTFGEDFIPPNSYLILCQTSAVASYQSYGKTIGLNVWPTLNNDNDYLKLVDQAGALIDEVAYTDDWYKDEVKKQGGYTLELIDPKNNCKRIQNWTSSVAIIGGTPGIRNSVYQTQLSATAPKLLSAIIIDETTIRLEFNKYLDSMVAAAPANYSINNGVGNAISALPITPAFTVVEIKLAIPIARGVESLLTVNGLSDCAGNLIDPTANTAKLFWAKEIKPGNVLISEVLFNPRASNPDYVEVYNNTNEIFDLKELQLANLGTDGNTANIKVISNSSIYIHPKTYWVLTNNSAMVKQQYTAKFPNHFVQLSSMPAYNNDKGTVILLNGTTIIDRFDYLEKMHMALLGDPDGVALERISFTNPTNEPGNFRSAAQAVGFGTPTYINSQMEDESIVKNMVTLSSKTFSPDGDGFEDLLNIDYRFKEGGNLATVNVYTDRGVLVRKLQRNTTIPIAGSFVWDGLDDNGKTGRIGIYVIKFNIFSLNGKIDKFTKTCVLSAKL